MLVGISLDMVLFLLVLDSVGVLFLDPILLTTDILFAKVASCIDLCL